MKLPSLVTLVLILTIAPTRGTLDLLLKKKIAEAAKLDLLSSTVFSKPTSNFKDYYVLGGLVGPSKPQGEVGSSVISVPGSTTSLSIGGTGTIGGSVSIGSSVSGNAGIVSGGNNFGFTPTSQGSSNTGISSGGNTFGFTTTNQGSSNTGISSGGNSFGFTTTSQGSSNTGISSGGNTFGFTTTNQGSSNTGISSGGNSFGFTTTNQGSSSPGIPSGGNSFGVTSTNQGSSDSGIISGGNGFGFTVTNQGSGEGIITSNIGSQGGISGTLDITTGSQGGITIPNDGVVDGGVTTIFENTGTSVSVSDDSVVSGFGTISSGGVIISGNGGNVGGSLVSIIDGGVIGLGGGIAICPDVTLPVIEDVVWTQYATEYVTVPQQIENYVISTVPFVKPLYVTQTVPVTVTEINDTGYCTSTHLFYQTEVLSGARIIPITQSLTETELVERTRTLTNTLTETSIITQVQTQIQTVFTTVVGRTRTITRVSTTTEFVTDTVTSQYTIRSTTVAGVGVPVWITSNTEVWLPVTRTRTINKTSYQTVWTSCGAGYY